MDLRDTVRDLAKRSKLAVKSASTEEATKTSVVMPFLKALGFDVFDLNQVVPEFVADVGVKKGEKVDYVLIINNEVAMLVEAKPVSSDLSEVQFNQLYRYFSVTDARIGILTNGRQFWFFTDIDEKNRMDKRPFFVFDLENYDDEDAAQLTKFHRDQFDLDGIMEDAAALESDSKLVE